MSKKLATKSKAKTFVQKTLATFGSAGFALLALLHLLFAQGAAGIGIWVQAIPALLAFFAFALSAYRLVKGLPVAAIIFLGTLPLWLIHIPITVFVEDESPIFLISTSITPAVSGVILLIKRKK